MFEDGPVAWCETGGGFLHGEIGIGKRAKEKRDD
jgi:hypothetical protein